MKVIFELVVQDVNVTAELAKQKQLVRELTKELAGVDAGAEGFTKLAENLAAAKTQVADLTQQQKELNREFKQTQVPVDSLAGLRLEYSKLTEQISRLSASERNSDAGKSLIQNAANVKAEINGIQESVGNFTGNVGNYKGGLLAASEALTQFGGNLGTQSAVLQTAIGVFEAGAVGAKKLFDTTKEGAKNLGDSVSKFRDYVTTLKDTEKANKDIAESTGAASDAVANLADGSGETAENMTEAAKGTGLLSRAAGVLKGALAAIGIGLVISLVVGLIAVFQRFAPIIDFVEQSVAGLSAAFDVFVSRVAKVAQGIGKVFTGDFAGAFDDVSAAVDGMGKQMIEAAFAAAQLKKEFQDLEDAQKDFELTTARTEAAIAKLSVSLKDKTRSDSERLKIADQISGLERKNLEEKTGLIEKEIDIERRRLLLNGQLTKEQADQIASGNFELARQLEDQFLLRADEADRIRELLIQRTKAEGESATLLERVENRRSAIIEAAAEKQKAAREKQKAAAEKAQKDIEAQVSRIRELQKSIQDLDAATITNDFDRASVEIENKRAESLQKVALARENLTKKIAEQKGVLSAADIKELQLIDEQAASITAAYDNQQEIVSKNRENAAKKQLADLAKLSADVTSLAEQNAVALARAESEIVNTGFLQKQNELETILNQRKIALSEQLEAGTISQKKFKDEFLKAQETFNLGTLDLERQRSNEIKGINASLEEARIEAARAALNVRLLAIKEETEAEIQAQQERARAQGGDATQSVDRLRAQEIEKRKAAEQEFSDATRAAADERVKNEAAALDAINNADQKVHEDKLQRIQDEAEKRRELQQQLLDAAGTLAGAIFEIERNRIDKQEETAIANLDTEFQKRRDAAAGNAAELEKIEVQYQARKEVIEKEAARKRKRTAIVEATIQGALAIVKSLPNLVLAALTAVATAAQIAVISSQTFEKGGIAQFRKSGTFGGKRHSQGGTKGVFDDGTQVEVEEDELFVVLNRRASSELRKLSNFNAKHGGRRFADGGVLDFTPQFQGAIDGTSGGAVFVVAQFTDEQVISMADQIGNKTATETRKAVIAGLDDRNRTAEREAILEENRQI